MTAREGKPVEWSGLHTMRASDGAASAQESSYQRVCAALQEAGCRPGSGQDWTGPTHDDSIPSLGVSPGRDGGVVFPVELTRIHRCG